MLGGFGRRHPVRGVGPIDKGFRRLAKTFRWVGSRFRSGRLVPEHLVVASSGDLAYTVGFERGEVPVDDGPPRLMTIRVTHIYRRFGETWRLVVRLRLGNIRTRAASSAWSS